jgi:hypothetical protein
MENMSATSWTRTTGEALAKRKRADSAVGGVLGYFDKDLAVRRRLFVDAVTICDLETSGPAEVSPADRGALRCGQATVCLSGVLDWLEGFAARCSTFYAHHHDNIVAEVVLFEPYRRETFLRCLPWFRTHPADEGGANLLGIVGRGWLLLLVNDNQGRFRFEFFGPAESCDTLREQLGQHDPIRQPDG